jgi:hypothetical protein
MHIKYQLHISYRYHENKNLAYKHSNLYNGTVSEIVLSGNSYNNRVFIIVKIRSFSSDKKLVNYKSLCSAPML